VDTETIKDLGAPIAMTVAMSYYIWRMTQFLLTSLTDSLAENHTILVKLIESINAIKSDQTSRICELEQRVAEVREQHRNYSNMLVGNRGGERVQQPRSDS
jgi:hypothetical protein